VVKINSYRRDKGTFNGWIFAVARNILIDYTRARKRDRHMSMEIIGQIACTNDSPEDILIRGEGRDKLLQALEKLGDRERDIIGLKFAGQLTNIEIAEMTGLTTSNVAVIIYRSVQRLRGELEAMGWHAND